MSIEEKARAAANKRYPFCGAYIPQRPSFEAGYIQGATEQEEECSIFPECDMERINTQTETNKKNFKWQK